MGVWNNPGMTDPSLPVVEIRAIPISPSTVPSNQSLPPGPEMRSVGTVGAIEHALEWMS